MTAAGVAGVLFYSHFYDRGKVLGAAEMVAMEVPDNYTEPLLVASGDKYLRIIPQGGTRVPVEHVDQRYIYHEAYKYTDVIQTQYDYKIKEELVFSRPGHPVVFRYTLENIENYITHVDSEGNIIFYDRQLYETNGESPLAQVFIIPTPFIEDASHSRSFRAITAQIQDNELIVIIDPKWLQRAVYPVVVDPTVEVKVINVYSHPQLGDDWRVEFITKGRADLKIIPDDQATIDDDEFVSLTCDGIQQGVSILPDDVIFAPDWYCEGIGEVVHYTKVAGKHRLRFDFGGQIVYAYNDAGDPWWDGAWSYRLPVIVDNLSNSDTLTDFQVYVKMDSSLSDFWSHVDVAGDDVRWVAADGSTTLDFFQLHFNTSTDEAIYWVKADSLAANATTTLYLYYGNATANSSSSAENTFSYSTRERRFVLMGDYNDSGSYMIPFFDNTSFAVDTATSSTDIDTAIRYTLTSGQLTQNGTVVSSTKPIAIAGNVSSADMWQPFSWMSEDMFGYTYQANPEIEFYNPNSTTIVIDVYDSGTLDTAGISINSGAIDDRAYVGSAVFSASSTLPVMMYIEGGANRIMPIPPSATKVYGHTRNTRIAAGANGANYDLFCDNGSSNSGSISAYGYASDTTCNGTYGTTAGYVSSTYPVEVSAHADGNGSDSQVWFREKDLDTEYIIPDNYAYMSVVTPYPNTTVEVYTISGGVWSLATSGSATRSGSGYSPYLYKDGTSRSGGVKVVANNPIYLYYDSSSGTDESNAANRVINRKGTWPEPEVSSFAAEETAPAGNAVPTISAVTESSDPIAAGQDLYWSVDWNDTDGDKVKVVVCSTNSITDATLTCGATKYCESPVYTDRDPEGNCSYTTQTGDIGTLNYYAFACDDSGESSVCSSGHAGSVSVEQQSPTTPTELLTENMPNAVNVSGLTPIFSAMYNDPNPNDVAVKCCIEVNTQSDFAGTNMWQSDGNGCTDGVAMATTTANARSPNITYAGTSLSLDKSVYFWRLWFWDQGDNKSTTSSVASFQMASGTDDLPQGVRLKGGRLQGGRYQ